MSEAPEDKFERTDKYNKPKPGSKTQQNQGKIPVVRKNSKPVSALGVGGDTVAGKQNENGQLTEMQRRFVNYLVRDRLPQTAALKAAGYSPNPSTATALMKNPKIIKAIAEEKGEYAKASGITKKKVVDGFLEAIEMGRVKGDPVAMIAGWREIGKICGLYEPQKTKVEVSVNGQVMIQRLQTMTDEELLQLADGNVDALSGEFNVVDE